MVAALTHGKWTGSYVQSRYITNSRSPRSPVAVLATASIF